MGIISYQIPVPGQAFSTEAAKADTALQTLLTLVNGNVDTNNLAAAAGILPAQLAAGNARFQYVSAVANQAATDGHLYVGVGGITLTLTAVQDAVVTVVANSAVTGASPVTVSAGAGKIYGTGTGAAGATTVLLGTASAHLMLYCFNGTDWLIVSGQQDSGWVALTAATHWSATAGAYAPAVRLVADTVRMSGALTGDGTNFTPLNAALSSAFRPASNVTVASAGGAAGLSISTAGIVGAPASTICGLDGVQYRLI